MPSANPSRGSNPNVNPVYRPGVNPVDSQGGLGRPHVVSSSPQRTTKRTSPKVKVGNRGKGAGKGKGHGGGNGGGNKPAADPYAALVDAAMQYQYGPAIAAAQRQQAAIPGYFDAYRSTVQGLQNGIGTAYGQGVQQLGQLGQSLNQGTANVLAAARGQQAQGAQPGAVANQGVLDDAAKAAAVRNQMVGGFGGLVQSQGLTEQSYLANRAASSAPLQANAQIQAGQGLSDLLAQRGAAAVKYRGDLQQAAAQNEIDRQKIQSALRIAGLNAATTIKTNVQDNAATQANNRRTTAASQANNRRTTATSRANAQARQNAQDQKDRQKQQQQNQADSRKALGRIHDINSRFHDYKTRLIQPLGPDGKPKGPKRPPTPAEIRQKLRDDGFTGPEIYIASKLRGGYRFSRHDMEIARELGIIVPPGLRPSNKFGGKKKSKIKGGQAYGGVGGSSEGNVQG